MRLRRLVSMQTQKIIFFANPIKTWLILHRWKGRRFDNDAVVWKCSARGKIRRIYKIHAKVPAHVNILAATSSSRWMTYAERLDDGIRCARLYDYHHQRDRQQQQHNITADSRLRSFHIKEIIFCHERAIVVGVCWVDDNKRKYDGWQYFWKTVQRQ